MRRLRIIIGISIFVLSIALLIWGLMPLGTIRRTQPISPEDLQLPTPISLQTPLIFVS